MKKIGALILLTVMILAVFSGCSNTATVSVASATYQPLINNYGEQLPQYLDKQYYFDDKPISIQESNFYFINAYLDLSTYAMYGYFPANAKGYLDLSAACTEPGYATYGDYFIEYAENSLESTCILLARAEAEGVTVTDEIKASIDTSLNDMKTNYAAPAGQTLDDYLQAYYGPGNTEAAFRTILERYYLADAYSKVYCENYVFSDEEKFVPYLRYALFYAPETSDQATKDKALETATAMKNACSTIDDLTGLAQNAQQAGTVYDQGDILVPRGRMVPKFEEWAYEAGRTVGELDIIYAPEYGYFVVGYLGTQEQEKAELDQIALQKLSQSLLDEINAGTHNLHSTDVKVSSMTTTDVLIVVFFTLAGVAIAAVIVILIVNAMKKNKDTGSRGKSSSKNSSKPSNSKNKAADKPKSSKKRYEEDDEDDEEEYDEDEDEDEDDE